MKNTLKILFLAISLCVLLSVTSLADGVSLTVSSVRVSPESQSAEVTISLSGNTGLSGLQLSMSYEEGLVLEGITRGDGLGSMTYTKPNDLTDNPISLLLDAETDDSSNGLLYTLSFSLPTEKKAEYSVNVSVVDAYDFDLNTVDVAVTNGKISIEQPDDSLTYLGTSLILDGSIGVKMSFEYDSQVVDAESLTMTGVITDSSTSTSKEVDVPVTFDEDGKTVYGIVYVAPKDIDNVSVNVTISAKTVNGAELTVDNIPSITVPAYISVIKDYAETNEEYAKALDLVLALEKYCDYADKYYDKSVTEVDEIELTDAQKRRIEGFAIAPQVSVANLGAIKYYSSSLILNETVTIRHYFTVTGEINLNDYTVEGANELKKAKGNNNLVYIDITDIPAQKLSEYWTAKISYADSSMTVKFSPLNYAGLIYESDDAKLRNLVKSIAEYSYQADLYTGKADEVITPDENETEIDKW